MYIKYNMNILEFFNQEISELCSKASDILIIPEEELKDGIIYIYIYYCVY